MSENTTADYSVQGFYGPMAIAVAEKLIAEATTRAVLPETGLPPINADRHGTDGMWAVLMPPGTEYPTPAGMKPANDDMVRRMVGG